MGWYGRDSGKITIPLLEVPVPGRICWECEHLNYSEGSHGYSDMTPGSDMHLCCGQLKGGKYYWEYGTRKSGGGRVSCCSSAHSRGHVEYTKVSTMSADDVMDLVPYFDDPPTERQIELLNKWGFYIPETKEEATEAITKELEYRRNHGWREDDHDGVEQCNDETPYED